MLKDQQIAREYLRAAVLCDELHKVDLAELVGEGTAQEAVQPTPATHHRKAQLTAGESMYVLSTAGRLEDTVLV